MASQPTSHPLVALGFTALEAEIYSLLLEEEAPATGYRVAQALRKPASNIYKALESLESKGAVMVDEGESRLCRPIPPEELLRPARASFPATSGRRPPARSPRSRPRRPTTGSTSSAPPTRCSSGAAAC